MKYLSHLLTALLLSGQVHAQGIDWQHYKPLQCAGKVPDDFTELSSQKYQTEKQEIDVNAKRGIQKSQDQFYL